MDALEVSPHGGCGVGEAPMEKCIRHEKEAEVVGADGKWNWKQRQQSEPAENDAQRRTRNDYHRPPNQGCREAFNALEPCRTDSRPSQGHQDTQEHQPSLED